MAYSNPQKAREYNRRYKASAKYKEARKRRIARLSEEEKSRLREQQREQQREYSRRPGVRQKRAEAHRKWKQKRQADPERVSAAREKKQQWVKHNRASIVASRRRYGLKKFGLTVEQYEEILIRQNNVCALCGQPSHRNRLAVDHDHNTG